ncbi:hypothetical protein M513_14143 [Trichuris suis]|uniref:Uncharacterized protein n=1 Tax=Trichuris suis TaxID=68888 RepID=A0A085LJ34_9BILA|nr:hypothetical protein M513_14143 [Trichuris suis]
MGNTDGQQNDDSEKTELLLKQLETRLEFKTARAKSCLTGLFSNKQNSQKLTYHCLFDFVVNGNLAWRSTTFQR